MSKVKRVLGDEAFKPVDEVMTKGQCRVDGEKFKVECVRIHHFETDKAIGVYLPHKPDELMWFPLSQVHSIHRHPVTPYLIVTHWIARQKGLA